MSKSRLKVYLFDNNISQTDVHNATGITKWKISHICSGVGLDKLLPETKQKICDFLKVDVEEIFPPTLTDDQYISDSSIMPFGIHKGKKMIDVPAKYLLKVNKSYRNKEREKFTNVFLYIVENKHLLIDESNQGV